MSDQMMSEVLARLDALVEKLGEGAEVAWPLFVRQAIWVDGVVQLVGGILLAIAAVVLVRLAFVFGRRSAEVNYVIPAVVSVVVAAIIAPFSINLMFDAIPHLLNPEYYALMNIAKMLTGN